MTLQALRNRVGEPVFRQILREWTTGKRFGNATIEDFTQHASAVAGADLAGLFDVWLFTATKPDATVENGFLADAWPAAR
jgi:aminopeptidase N